MSGPVQLVITLTIVSSLLWLGERLSPESSPVARGEAYAANRKCIGCHGVAGDPVADRNDGDCSGTDRVSWHPDYEVDCVDVLAYFEAVRLRRNFSDRVATDAGNALLAGEQLAREYHCFQCHGYLGQGGLSNADSVKGYVPGYFGEDFEILTRGANPDSVRLWIEHGLDDALVDQPVTGPVAALFLRRQAISMPSFGSLRTDEIDLLVSYVLSIHQMGPMTAQSIREYELRTQADTREQQ